MNNLILYPTFLCPFSCQYCLFKNKLSLDETLSIDNASSYIKNNINDIDNIIISGGDFLSLDKNYIYSLINNLCQYNKKIIIHVYPYNLEKIKNIQLNNNISYTFSYDFMAKPRAMEAWNNLYDFNKPYKIVITLSPLLFKYHPINLLKKLSQLSNLKEVEFVPYYKNDCNQFDITKNNNFVDMTKLILNCQLSLPYNLVNKEKIQQKILGSESLTKEIHMFPNGKTYHQYFDNDVIKFHENNGHFNDTPHLIIPKSIDMYNDEICTWFKSNVI